MAKNTPPFTIVNYVIGLARNERLVAEIEPELLEAQEYLEESGQSARVFRDFEYRTHNSWSRSRRVIGKAEQLPAGPNPRFVVTSLGQSEVDARTLYEDVYCAFAAARCGPIRSRIAHQQALTRPSDRTHSVRRHTGRRIRRETSRTSPRGEKCRLNGGLDPRCSTLATQLSHVER